VAANVRSRVDLSRGRGGASPDQIDRREKPRAEQITTENPEGPEFRMKKRSSGSAFDSFLASEF
jgi:hypothetical protein